MKDEATSRKRKVFPFYSSSTEKRASKVNSMLSITVPFHLEWQFITWLNLREIKQKKIIPKVKNKFIPERNLTQCKFRGSMTASLVLEPLLIYEAMNQVFWGWLFEKGF